MKKSNKLRGVSQEEFTKIYNNAKSYSEICRHFGLRLQGSNYKIIKKWAENFGLSKIIYDRADNLKSFRKIATPLDQVLVENSKAYSNDLKKRLFKENLLTKKCDECGLSDTWNGKPLILQLDHINGICNDNRLENLRILCPNCHTQTETHSGKRLKKKYICPSCHEEYAGYGNVCKDCHGKYENLKNSTYAIWYKEKIDWPSKEELEQMVWSLPTTKIAERLGVSDKAVEKRCKKLNIPKPPRGYWAKQKMERDTVIKTVTSNWQ